MQLNRLDKLGCGVGGGGGEGEDPVSLLANSFGVMGGRAQPKFESCSCTFVAAGSWKHALCSCNITSADLCEHGRHSFCTGKINFAATKLPLSPHANACSCRTADLRLQKYTSLLHLQTREAYICRLDSAAAKQPLLFAKVRLWVQSTRLRLQTHTLKRKNK